MNGISGIGTGFSCSIPSYNPMQIIQYLKNKLGASGGSVGEFVPYYEGFKGKIEKIQDNKYMVRGCYEKAGEDKILITELPIGTWTMPYITFLEELMDGTTGKDGKKVAPSIKDFKSVSTEVNVNILVTLPKGKLAELEGQVKDGMNGVERLFKLTTTISSTNMHMFNSKCKLHKYGSIEEIIDDFYGVRIETYRKRKEYLVEDMRRLLMKLSNRARYILGVLDDSIELRKKSGEQVTAMLESKGFDKLDGDYKYLVKMPMDSVTNENVQIILKEKEETEKKLDMLIKTSVEKMWIGELDVLEKEYAKYKGYREKLQKPEGQSGGGGKGGKVLIRKTK